MSSSVARRILYGLTLGVLLALVLAPQTRWLVRDQTELVLHVQPNPSDYAARVQALAARHPQDFPIQYVAAVENSQPLTALRALEVKFPTNVALRANVLRYACQNELHEDRPEDYLLDQEVIPPGTKFAPETTPAQFAAFIQDATVGERLDPRNAYFPFMLAACYYHEHHDAAARAALLRAGTKPDWNEYIAVEVQARWRVNHLLFGRTGALADATIPEAILLPEYSLLREATRVATYQAMLAEQQGHVAQGIALRQALIHCGGLMRADSSMLIGSLVGSAIDDVAMMRPGGTPFIKPPANLSKTQSQQFVFHRMALYAAFLRQHGDPTGAAQSLAELQADQQAWALMQSHINDLVTIKPLWTLIRWWTYCLVLLADALWLLLFGGVLWLLRQWWETRLRTTEVRGFAVGLAVLMLLWWGYALVNANPFLAQANEMFTPLDASFYQPTRVWEHVIFLVLLAPLLLLLAGLFRLRRARFAQTLVATSIPLACLILLVYAGVVLGTIRQEQMVTQGLVQSLHSEGAYLAQQSGQTWPGVVD